MVILWICGRDDGTARFYLSHVTDENPVWKITKAQKGRQLL